MKKILFLFIAASLFATVNEPLRWEFFSGYRNDRIHWHLQEPGDGGLVTHSEVYRDVQYWLNGLVLKVIHRDLVFFARGAYGAFGKGKLIHPHMATHGWCADASGYFGYAVNLTADRTYKVLLTPLVGYAAYFEQLHRSTLPGTFRLVWNGFFLGGQFTFETGGPVILNAGWAYNMMHNRVHAQMASGSLKTSSGGNKGQLGWAQMDWNLNCAWRLGIGGQMLYLTTRVVDATISHMDQKFKLRWTPVSGWVQVSRIF
ncbi:MAG: hypothetical protein K1X28_01225 [Parachlamydiales bacterium]|nr:hypothetical protein [Parachlamydiales bacterium]